MGSCKITTDQGVAVSKLRYVQINLQHCRNACDSLLTLMIQNKIDIALIQEPWIDKARVKGLNHKDFTLIYKIPLEETGKPRSCILVSKNLNAFLLSDYSDQDITSVILEGNNKSLVLVSAYLPHDDEAPTDTLRKLVISQEKKKNYLLIGTDANARHEVWGSSSTNERGECLLDFINLYNLSICNRGNKPTFSFPSSDIYDGWDTTLDVTLVNNLTFPIINNWKVLDENSFSYHRYITFDANFDFNIKVDCRNPRNTDWVKFKQSVLKHNPDHLASCESKEDLEKEVNSITSIFSQAYKSSCRVIRGHKKPLPSYFDNELIALRKKLRSQFNHCQKHGSWNLYKTLLKTFTRAKTIAKRKAWRDLCQSVETAKDTARLKKILSSEYTPPSLIMNQNGAWTESSEETNSILLDTHFPGNSKEPFPEALDPREFLEEYSPSLKI